MASSSEESIDTTPEETPIGDKESKMIAVPGQPLQTPSNPEQDLQSSENNKPSANCNHDFAAEQIDGNSHELNTAQPIPPPVPSNGQAPASDLRICFPAIANTPIRTQTPLPRPPSLLSMLKNGFPSFSSTNGSAHHKRSASPSPPLSRSRRQFSFGFPKSKSRNTSSTASPDIPGITQHVDTMDLDAVNRRLESAAPHGSSVNFASKVSDLEFHQHQVQACKKLLNEAMNERSRGNLEICRAKCVQIINSYYTADVETVVYAYNILSTQASLGQAAHFLDVSMKLVKRNLKTKPELEKLIGVIKCLRESAEERDEKASRRAKGQGSEERGEVQRGRKGKGMQLELPKPVLAMNNEEPQPTPKAEKILEWSTPEK